MTREQWANRKVKQPVINVQTPEVKVVIATQEKTDKELWFEVYAATSNSDTCKNSDVAKGFANDALKYWRQNENTTNS